MIFKNKSVVTCLRLNLKVFNTASSLSGKIKTNVILWTTPTPLLFLLHSNYMH